MAVKLNLIHKQQLFLPKLKAAFKLKDGEVSEPIAATNMQTYQTTYYVVKMTKNKAKGNDMKPYEKRSRKLLKKQN